MPDVAPTTAANKKKPLGTNLRCQYVNATEKVVNSSAYTLQLAFSSSTDSTMASYSSGVKDFISFNYRLNENGDSSLKASLVVLYSCLNSYESFFSECFFLKSKSAAASNLLSSSV